MKQAANEDTARSLYNYIRADLYAAGDFTTAGGALVNYVANKFRLRSLCEPTLEMILDYGWSGSGILKKSCQLP